MDLTGKISAVVLTFILCSSLLGPLMVAQGPDVIDLEGIRKPPSVRHPLGTDSLGRDVLARVLEGGRISISISVFSVIISTLIGLSLGLSAGYLGGVADAVILAAVDLVLAFPALLLAIGVSILLPPGLYTVVIAISAVGWAPFARLTRGYVLALRSASFVEAATAVGCTRARVLFVHILPHCIPLVLVMTGLKMGGYILTEAALSFLGLGAQPPQATWGSMISANRVLVNSCPWTVLSPGVMIAVTAICFNLLGDSLQIHYGEGRPPR